MPQARARLLGPEGASGCRRRRAADDGGARRCCSATAAGRGDAAARRQKEIGARAHTRAKADRAQAAAREAAARRSRGAAARGRARGPRRLRAHRRGRDRDRRAAARLAGRRARAQAEVRAQGPRALRRDRRSFGARRRSCRSSAASPARACWPTRSCVAGRTTCRCTASSGSTRREGLELARSTICGWHEELAALARAAASTRCGRTRSRRPYLCTDATGVLVQAQGEVPPRPLLGGGRARAARLFRVHAKHDGAAVDELLAGYKGYLVADAHAVYDHLYKTRRRGRGRLLGACPAVLLQGARVRPGARAPGARATSASCFAIERAIARRAAREARGRPRRRAESQGPIVDALLRLVRRRGRPGPRRDADRQGHRLRPQSTRRASALPRRRRLPVHNNWSRASACGAKSVGRKNWLFVGNDDAAEVNATFVSLLASCQLHDIEPWAYLRDLFCLLPSWPARRVLELAPVNWKQTLEHERRSAAARRQRLPPRIPR